MFILPMLEEHLFRLTLCKLTIWYRRLYSNLEMSAHLYLSSTVLLVVLMNKTLCHTTLQLQTLTLKTHRRAAIIPKEMTYQNWVILNPNRSHQEKWFILNMYWTGITKMNCLTSKEKQVGKDQLAIQWTIYMKSLNQTLKSSILDVIWVTKRAIFNKTTRCANKIKSCLALKVKIIIVH
jgi:hypothetical protein